MLQEGVDFVSADHGGVYDPDTHTVKWLVTGLEPNFRTISDFRMNNVDCLKKVFRKFDLGVKT